VFHDGLDGDGLRIGKAKGQMEPNLTPEERFWLEVRRRPPAHIYGGSLA
jgi:hypothetical protein